MLSSKFIKILNSNPHTHSNPPEDSKQSITKECVVSQIAIDNMINRNLIQSKKPDEDSENEKVTMYDSMHHLSQINVCAVSHTKSVLQFKGDSSSSDSSDDSGMSNITAEIQNPMSSRIDSSRITQRQVTNSRMTAAKNTHFKQNNDHLKYTGRVGSGSIVSEQVEVDVQSKNINDNIRKNIQNRGHLGNTAKGARDGDKGGKANSPNGKGFFCQFGDRVKSFQILRVGGYFRVTLRF